MKRRALIQLAAGSTAVLVASGVWRAQTTGVFSQGQGPAYELWETWKTDRPEGALGIIQAGILAANPHNTQPWLFSLQESDDQAQIEVYVDLSRDLGAMDPYRREMILGLGCALENMRLAAAAMGYAVEITLASGSLLDANLENAPVATLALTRNSTPPSELYEAIPNRHTNRAPYDPERQIPADILKAFAELDEGDPDLKLILFTNPDQRQPLAEATIQATEDIIADAEMIHDSDRWFRHGWQELQRERSGVHIDASGLPWGIRSLVKVLPPLDAAASHQAWLDTTRQTLPASPVLGLIAVRQLYDINQSLRAGQFWQRIHLYGTTQRIAMQPINQLPERVDRERQLSLPPGTAATLAQLTGDSTWLPTFAFRMGYPTTSALPSARRALSDVLI
jgi:hypothetical protein